MSKSLITLLLAFLLAGPAWPQEEPSGSDTEDPETSEAGEADEAEEVDDSDLDLQTYEEDEDDFIPSEEIPADEPIPFPSNI